MNCKECKSRCLPENPEEPFYIGGGNYLPPLCQYCNNRPDEEESPKIKEEPKWTASQWDYIQQLKGQILHLENKVDKLYERKTKARKDRI